jgi:hypothetical protein
LIFVVVQWRNALTSQLCVILEKEANVRSSLNQAIILELPSVLEFPLGPTHSSRIDSFREIFVEVFVDNCTSARAILVFSIANVQVITEHYERFVYLSFGLNAIQTHC